MARLKPTKRARLPDGAFACIDGRGRRRLPIHDEAHVRSALARQGLPDPEPLFQVQARGLRPAFPPPTVQPRTRRPPADRPGHRRDAAQLELAQPPA